MGRERERESCSQMKREEGKRQCTFECTTVTLVESVHVHGHEGFIVDLVAVLHRFVEWLQVGGCFDQRHELIGKSVFLCKDGNTKMLAHWQFHVKMSITYQHRAPCRWPQRRE